MKTDRMSTSGALVARGRSETIFSFRRGLARPSTCVSLKLVIGLSILGAAQPAAAERSIIADVTAIVPFDAAQLTAALRVRLPSEGAPVELRVTATPDGVRIEARGNVREVALRDLTGAAAARLVALAANDLLLDDLADLPLAAPSLTRSSTAPDRAATTVGVLGGAAAWQHVLGGLGVDLAIPRGAWLFAIDAGGGTLIDGPLHLTAATLRICGGARLGWLELRMGATLAPLIVSDGRGDSTILAGAGASVRIRVPIARGIRAVVAGGVDLFATTTTYLLAGSEMATPRAAPWIAAGMEVTP
jgi:hypothetical protein